MFLIVGSLRDCVVNGNVTAVRHFLTNSLTARRMSSEEHHPTDGNMTLEMLAARQGQLV